MVFTILAARYFLFWGLGALAVLMLGSSRPWVLALFGSTMFVVGTVSYQLAAPSKSFANISIMPREISEAIICLGICLVLPLLYDSRLNKCLAPLRNVATRASAMSYTLYLVHYPIIVALSAFIPKADRLSPFSVGTMLGEAIFIFLLAYLFYLAFEGQTGKIRRFARDRWLAGRRTEPVEEP